MGSWLKTSQIGTHLFRLVATAGLDEQAVPSGQAHAPTLHPVSAGAQIHCPPEHTPEEQTTLHCPQLLALALRLTHCPRQFVNPSGQGPWAGLPPPEEAVSKDSLSNPDSLDTFVELTGKLQV